MMFEIAIPSRSRPRAQKTIYNLSDDLWNFVMVVVPQDQLEAYRAEIPAPIKVIPFEGFGVAPKRDFILHMKPTGKILMFDDDLKFYKRSEEGSRFFPISPSDTIDMVETIVSYLNHYPMVGLVDKFMSQHTPRHHIECHRFNQTLCFNRDLLPDPKPRFRGLIAEEHDMMLQLLTRGCKTAVITEYSKTDKPYAKGGCSDWRTTEVMKQEIERMAQLWPGIVSYSDHPDPEHPQGYKVRFDWKKAKKIGGSL
jgi:hypothetical protein